MRIIPTTGHLFGRFWPAIFDSQCAIGKFDSCFYYQGSEIVRRVESDYESPKFRIEAVFEEIDHLLVILYYIIKCTK
jgi:hypothetical protein